MRHVPVEAQAPAAAAWPEAPSRGAAARGARGQLPRSPKRQSLQSLNRDGTSDERAAAHWHRHSQPAADGHAALACQ